MILDTTGKSLEAFLGAIVATTQPKYFISYADHTSTTFVPGATGGALNSTTDVTVLAAPAASTQRQVKYAAIYNEDTANVTVNVQLDDGGVERLLLTATLAPGQTLEWTPDRGWQIALAIGSVTAAQVVNVAAGNIVATNVQAALNELDTEKVKVAGDTMTGALNLPAGSVAAPSLTIGDTDTGLSWASNVLSASINGVLAASIDAAAIKAQNLSGSCTVQATSQGNQALVFAQTFGDATTNQPINKLVRYRNTQASPNAVAANDILGDFQIQGGTTNGSGAVATAMRDRTIVTAATPSATDMQSRRTIELCPAASVTLTEILRLEHATGLSMFGANVVVDTSRVFRNRMYTVATLPAGVAGMVTFVSDALAPAFNTAVVGGGTVDIPVYYDGTAAAWKA